jgi:DNA-binding CsgD family transcriptional regulator
MLERFSALVEQIYEGCTDPSAWTRIVSVLANHLEAEKGLLLTPFDAPDRGGFIFPHGIAQHHISLWKTRYLPADLWARRLLERGLIQEGNVVLAKDIVTDEELLESAWYREFLSLMDIFHIVVGIVFTADHPDFPFTGCAFYRGIKGVPFEEPQRSKLRLLMPHISRALGVMLKLRDAEFRVAASLHALNEIRQGILLLDDNCGICFANTAAEHILQRQDGLRLGEQVGAHRMLAADDFLATAALERVLRSNTQAMETDPKDLAHTIMVRRPSGSMSYAVQVSRLPESNPYRAGAVTPCAVVFIKDGTLISAPEPGLLQKVYDLTQAEARAALALCDGGSLDTVAVQLNVKLNTLKTHLKSIYLKTSVDNRAALTKLMLSLSNA